MAATTTEEALARKDELRIVLDLLFDDLGKLGVKLPPEDLKGLHTAAQLLSAKDFQAISDSGSVSGACERSLKERPFCKAFRAALKRVANARQKTTLKKAVAAAMAAFTLWASHKAAHYYGKMDMKSQYHRHILPFIEKVIHEGKGNVSLWPGVLGVEEQGWHKSVAGVAYQDKRHPERVRFARVT